MTVFDYEKFKNGEQFVLDKEYHYTYCCSEESVLEAWCNHPFQDSLFTAREIMFIVTSDERNRYQVFDDLQSARHIVGWSVRNVI